MTTASLSRCPSCQAIVNAHWVTCLACRGLLEPEPQERSASSPPASNWHQEWRSLAQVSGCLSGGDPRFDPILAALAACDSAYKSGDRLRFMKEAGHVMRISAFVPGAVIRWRRSDKKLQGPATVNEVIYEDGRLWACVKWAGQLYWVNEIIIESISTRKGEN